MLDMDRNMCDSETVTAAVPQFGTGEPCHRIGESSHLIKFTHGGSRPGAGRKPKPAQPIITDIPRWYCVRTEFDAEITADQTIRTAGFTTFFPLAFIPEKPVRKAESGRPIPAQPSRIVPLFRRYLFVQFLRSAHDWRHITTMRGVERVISSSPERPTPIPERDIDGLRAILAPNGCLYPPSAEKAAGVKKRWVRMLDGLAGLAAVEAV